MLDKIFPHRTALTAASVRLRIYHSIDTTSSGSVVKRATPSEWCMIPSTGGSNPPRSGDEPDSGTNTDKNE